MKTLRVVAVASVFWVVALVALALGSGSALAVLLGLAAQLAALLVLV